MSAPQRGRRGGGKAATGSEMRDADGGRPGKPDGKVARSPEARPGPRAPPSSDDDEPERPAAELFLGDIIRDSHSRVWNHLEPGQRALLEAFSLKIFDTPETNTSRFEKLIGNLVKDDTWNKVRALVVAAGIEEVRKLQEAARRREEGKSGGIPKESKDRGFGRRFEVPTTGVVDDGKKGAADPPKKPRGPKKRAAKEPVALSDDDAPLPDLAALKKAARAPPRNRSEGAPPRDREPSPIEPIAPSKRVAKEYQAAVAQGSDRSTRSKRAEVPAELTANAIPAPRKPAAAKRKAVVLDEEDKEEEEESVADVALTADEEEAEGDDLPQLRPASPTASDATAVDEDEAPTDRKQRPAGVKAALTVVPKVDKKLQKRMKDIVAGIRGLESEGYLIASIFEVIPTDNIAPGYSALVQEPIALSDIERNIKTGGYESFYEFLGDLHLMVSNAKFYNKQGSYPYKFATAIEKYLGKLPEYREVVEESRQRAAKGSAAQDRADDEVRSQGLDIIKKIRSYADKEGYQFAIYLDDGPFRDSDPGFYLQYPEPITLKEVVEKLTKGTYGSMAEVFKDLRTMIEQHVTFFAGKPTERERDHYNNAVEVNTRLKKDYPTLYKPVVMKGG